MRYKGTAQTLRRGFVRRLEADAENLSGEDAQEQIRQLTLTSYIAHADYANSFENINRL